MKKYDYLIVGSGLFGATFAHLAHKQGKTCLVIDKRPHLGGNIYCENIEGINVHKYGAHIFHTSNKEVWNFVNSIVEFNRYTNRLPVRLIFDNNYFNDKYQGIPMGGYNKLIDGLLEGADTKVSVDFFKDEIELPNGNKGVLKDHWKELASKLVFTGKIDEFYNYQFGKLNYRTVRFEQETIDCPNYQGNAVVNYTEREVPYTRVIEHKHFEMFGAEVYETPKTVISKEYSTEWKDGMEPYYPVNDKENSELYAQYKNLADQEEDVIFGGRLAEYKYYDMAPIIEKALAMFK